LFVGWVIETKGVGELVEAWARLRPNGWKLEIIGPVDSAYRDSLLARYSPERVEFIGSLSHAKTMERMAKCDLFILPSYTEGFPNVVVEAMALRRAIIATDVGAIPEMLGSDAGVLVKSRDVDALTEALDAAIRDPSLRDRISNCAFEKAARQYSIDVIFNEYLALWNRIASVVRD
jgi:glycosyltransferase involved in cell wall biosynthesis